MITNLQFNIYIFFKMADIISLYKTNIIKSVMVYVVLIEYIKKLIWPIRQQSAMLNYTM